MKKSRVVAVIALAVVVLVAVAMLMHVFPFNTGNGNPTPTPSTPPSTGINTNPPTTTPSIPSFHSLNGTVYCLSSEEITEQLWSRMRDYNASDPSIKGYIDWLREALSPQPHKALNVPWYPSYRYYWFNDRHGWSVPLPSEDDVVRVGLAKLPFGAGLVVTAYQASDGLVIVVHGTIINSTEWRELLARTAAFAPYPSPTIYGWESWGVKGRDYFNNSKAQYITHWVLWRISVKGHGSYLDTGKVRVPIKEVVVLIEMPVHELYFDSHDDWYLLSAEVAYWAVLGEPALALAINIAYQPDTDIWYLYKTIGVSMTVGVVTTDAHHARGGRPVGRFMLLAEEPTFSMSPVMLRASRAGVCSDYTSATTLFASNALGTITVAIPIDAPNGLGHVLSALVLPSSRFWAHDIELPIDIDHDGENDTGIVITDTAHLDPSYINDKIGNVQLILPLMWNYNDNVDEYVKRYGYILYWIGAVQSIMKLPDWLKTPWLPEVMKVINYTRIVAEARKAFVEHYYQPEAIYQPMPVEEFIKTVSNLTAVKVWTRYMPPGYTLGISKVIDKIPVVNAGETPGLCNTSVVCRTVESRIVLSSSDGKHYTGSVVVNNRNITVSAMLIVYLEGFNEYIMNTTIYIDSTPVFHADELRLPCSLYTGSCSKTVPVEYNNIAYILTLELGPTSNGNEDNGSGSESNTSPGTRTINTTAQLSPIYITEETPWGTMPVFDKLRGTSIVNNTNVTVEAFFTGDGYDVHVYINGTYAYGTHTGLPATLEFSYNGIEYEVTVELPEPPVLNQTITLELVPIDHIPVQLPNGTTINITVYMVNQTITVGNVSIVVYGYVSQLRIDLDIYVFGVPPADYTVTIEGLNTTTTMDYAGALHIYIHYEAPENQLIPQGTATKIMIQPLNLITIILLLNE